MLRRVSLWFSSRQEQTSPLFLPLYVNKIRRELRLGGFFSRKPFYGGPMPKIFGFLRDLLKPETVFSVSRCSFSYSTFSPHPLLLCGDVESNPGPSPWVTDCYSLLPTVFTEVLHCFGLPVPSVDLFASANAKLVPFYLSTEFDAF